MVLHKSSQLQSRLLIDIETILNCHFHSVPLSYEMKNYAILCLNDYDIIITSIFQLAELQFLSFDPNIAKKLYITFLQIQKQQSHLQC